MTLSADDLVLFFYWIHWEIVFCQVCFFLFITKIIHGTFGVKQIFFNGKFFIHPVFIYLYKHSLYFYIYALFTCWKFQQMIWSICWFCFCHFDRLLFYSIFNSWCFFKSYSIRSTSKFMLWLPKWFLNILLLDDMAMVM